MIKVVCIKSADDIYSEMGLELHRSVLPKVAEDNVYYVGEADLELSRYHNIYIKDNEDYYLGKFDKKYFINVNELREQIINKILEND